MPSSSPARALWLVAGAIGLGGAIGATGVVARAEPSGGWAEPDPAAVVGRWRGAASWRACVGAAPARVTLEVARDGSGYAVDLAPVLDGLRPVVLVPMAPRRLEAGLDELRVTWTTGKANQATLEVRFASGCTGTLRLTRDGTGAPACDELAGLTAVAAACEGVPAPGLGDADRAAIAGAGKPGRARAAASKVCARHAPPLRAALVEAGCVPAPVAAGPPGVRVPECDALLATVARLARCERVPVEVKQRLEAGMHRLARSSTVPAGDGAAEARALAAATCEQARVDLAETMAVVGCP